MLVCIMLDEGMSELIHLHPKILLERITHDWLTTFLVTYLSSCHIFDICESRSDHCSMSAKASKSLNFLYHTVWSATTEANSMAYKSLVRLSLEYACAV